MNFGITGNRIERRIETVSPAPVKLAQITPDKVKNYMLQQLAKNALTGTACIFFNGKVRSATLQYQSGWPYVIISNFFPRTNSIGVVYHLYIDGSNRINEHKDTAAGVITSSFAGSLKVLSTGENTCLPKSGN